MILTQIRRFVKDKYKVQVQPKYKDMLFCAIFVLLPAPESLIGVTTGETELESSAEGKI